MPTTVPKYFVQVVLFPCGFIVALIKFSSFVSQIRSSHFFKSPPAARLYVLASGLVQLGLLRALRGFSETVHRSVRLHVETVAWLSVASKTAQLGLLRALHGFSETVRRLLTHVGSVMTRFSWPGIKQYVQRSFFPYSSEPA